MNCKNCGANLNSSHKFCPNCGLVVDNSNNLNIPTGMSANEEINGKMHNKINIDGGVNINNPTEIGFKGKAEDDFSQFSNSSSKNSFEAINNVEPFDINKLVNYNDEKKNDSHGISSKRKTTWIAIGIGVIAVIIIGIFLVPIFLGNKLNVYEDEKYSLKYNNNWRVDEEQEKMTLYYSDTDNKFLLSGIATFEDLNFEIDGESDRKVLYESFYKAWSSVDGGSLTGGTDTFLELDEDSLYARIDYKLSNNGNIGAFYVVVSENYNTVISFMSYCTKDNWEVIDADIMEMIDSITYTNGAVGGKYTEFKAGKTKDYTSVGYMDYKVPDSWTLDEARSQAVSYKSYIFKFKDGISLLDIKGLTPYDSLTMKTGTSYEAMKSAVLQQYGGIKKESTKTVNGKVWYVIVTPDYNSGSSSFHNEIYFTLSNTNTHLYYFEAYISNDTTKEKTKYIEDSIEYILESAKLYKVDE